MYISRRYFRKWSLALVICCFADFAFAQENTPVYVIPVVFHVISANPYALPDSFFVSGLKDLNDAFAHAGAYASGQPGANTGITFCIAKTDPNGGNTNGITRTQSVLGNFDKDIEDDKLKNLVSWDTKKYCNIWFVDGVQDESYGSYNCGIWLRAFNQDYATFEGDGKFTDGIVTSGFGVPLAYLMGVYLGLRNTFIPFNCTNNNCAIDGDGICDTPPSSVAGGSCTNPQNSCNTDALSGFKMDVPDLTSNFMSTAGCANEFTQGQAVKMRANLTTIRGGLIAQSECVPPCSENILSYFTRDNWSPVIGSNVNFTSTSTGGTNYQWSVNGTVVGSNSTSYSQTFNAAGTYMVTLKVYNDNTNCYSTYSDKVIVTCGVMARFDPNVREIAAKAPLAIDSIFFTNRSVNGASYQWWMSSDAGMAASIVGTGFNLNYTFTVPGNYSVWLVASNGSCSDTTEKFNFPVYDPTQDGVMYLNDVECYQQNKVLAKLQVCNNGYSPIPANMPITLYDADPHSGSANKLGTFFMPQTIDGHCCSGSYPFIVNVSTPGLNQLYAVFNDSGTTKPFTLPGTSLQEVTYTNNIAYVNGFQLNVIVNPSTAILQPGDTLQLGETITNGLYGNGVISSYLWSTAQDMNCTNCYNPYFIAEKKIYSVRKELIVTNSYGCVDSSFAVIKIPPYDDFKITIDSVACAGTNNMELNFTVCNNFIRGNIPAGLRVAFYDADPGSAGANLLGSIFTVPASSVGQCASFAYTVPRTTTGKVFAVVNDSSGSVPVHFPDDSTFIETDYTNNIASVNYLPLTVSITPANDTLQPGDTLTLSASAGPGVISSYLWSNSPYLSCTNCESTVFIAGKKNTTEQVIATNAYGCSDTATVLILIPPADDYAINIDSMKCSANDSLIAWFTICNLFKRGIVPQGLKVAFYDANPAVAGANLLGPVFVANPSAMQKCFSFVQTIKGVSAGTVYAVVNDSLITTPVTFPQDTLYLEKDYSNNINAYAYAPDTVSLQPSDTTVFRHQTFPVTINTPVYDPSSTAWFPGNGYTLSCTSCASPLVTVADSSVVQMQTANQYGCLIKGKSVINIFPPDFTVQILGTTCYSNTTSLVKFKICINNDYDSIYAGLPVSFYDGDPAGGNAKVLSPVFYLQKADPVSCDSFTFIVNTPSSQNLYAVVNDKGDNPSIVPDIVFNETDYTNNMSNVAIIPFLAQIAPSDTIVLRNSTIQLLGSATGGQLTAYTWMPADFLSCTNCLNPSAYAPYSVKYAFIAKNENQCLDTAYADIRTFAPGVVDIPTAFTPNGDGHNDIFYIMGDKEVQLLNEFAIFDRWGKQMFAESNVPANDPHYGWDGMSGGKKAEAGAYVYVAKVQFSNGAVQLYKGTVVLIR